MSVKITRNMAAIQAKIKAGNSMMIPAVTESVIEYGNVFVPEDQGTLKDSALIASRPQDGLAIWDTPYAKRRYYTGTPSKDKNQNASLQWVEKGVNTYKKELDQVAQNAFSKGMSKKMSVYDDVLTAVIDLAEQTELYSKNCDRAYAS